MSVKIQLYKSKRLSDGSHPIVLRVYERGERFVIQLPYSCHPVHWNSRKNLVNSKYRGDQEQVNSQIRKHYAKVLRIRDQFNDEGLDFADTDLFKSMLFESKKAKDTQNDNCTIYEYLEKYIDRKESAKRYYQKENFRTLKSRLFGSKRCKGYFPTNKLFSALKVGDLRDFISHLQDEGVKGAIWNYMKDFRAMYNDAEEEEIFMMTKNPFKKISFGKFTSDYNPRGLSVDDLKKLLHFEIAEYPDLQNSYYTFILAYYGAGIRFTDLCKINYKDNVVGDKIVYKASKTHKVMPPITIDEDVKFLLDKLDTGCGYITPFLNQLHKTEKQVFNRIKKCNKQYNTDLKKIGILLDIELKITSHVARHSVGSVLIEMGASIREIQGVYNHQRSDTTRHYLIKFS